MAFRNLTGSGTEKKKFPLIFLRPAFSNDEMDTIVTSKSVPITDCVQIKSLGGCTLTPTATTGDLENDQDGVVGTVQEKMEFTLEINFSAVDLPILQDIMLLDYSSESGEDVLWLKQGRNVDITDLAISAIIYDKNLDSDNNTNSPDLTKDSETWIIFRIAPDDRVPLVMNGEQNSGKATFKVLASRSTGSSGGICGGIGAFTPVA
jgi:hypothetical protein